MTIRGCSGKIGYVTRAAADAARRGFRIRAGEAGRLHAYHCGHCGGFHLGRKASDHGPERRAQFDKGAKLRRFMELVREARTARKGAKA